MLYKLLSFGWIVLTASSAFAQSADDVKRFGYRGRILSSMASNSLVAVSSNGRFIYYASPSSATVFRLDTQDMITTASALTAAGRVKGLGFISGRLVVMTDVGAQYYDVSKPKDAPSEITADKFERPKSSTNTVTSACVVGNTTVFLEDATNVNDRILRVASGKTQVHTIPLNGGSGLFTDSSVPDPRDMRCTPTLAVVFADKNMRNGTDFKQWVATVAADKSTTLSGVVNVTDSDTLNFDLVDIIVDSSSQRLFALFNKKNLAAEGESVSNTKLLTYSLPTLVKITPNFEVGRGGRSLATYAVGQTHFWGLFIQKDMIQNSLERFFEFPFTSPLDLNSAARGLGSTTIGNASIAASFFSRWYWSSDHYVYGQAESSGLSLLSKAPQISVAQTNIKITASEGLKFSLNSEEPVNYEFYFDKSNLNYPSDLALTDKPGSNISMSDATNRMGVWSGIEITKDQLGVEKEGDQTLYVIARRSSAPNDPYARAGVRFSYDIPPPQVSGLKLGYGDQTVYVSFGEPNINDLKSYRIHFATDPSLIATAEGRRARDINTGMTLLTSPIEVTKANWKGTLAIAPFANATRVYVRVEAVDNSNQATGEPEEKSIVVSRTLSIAEALGSEKSCGLKLREPSLLFSLFLIACTLTLRFLRQKSKAS